MKKEQNKIEEILGSLDGNQRATAPSFFYTRLKARMEKGMEPAVRRPWILRPAFAFTALLVVILINAAVIFGSDSNPDNNISETDTYQSIAAEYNLNDSITEEVYK